MNATDTSGTRKTRSSDTLQVEAYLSLALGLLFLWLPGLLHDLPQTPLVREGLLVPGFGLALLGLARYSRRTAAAHDANRKSR